MSAKLNIEALVVASGIAAGAVSSVSAETHGLVRDPLGSVKIAKGAYRRLLDAVQAGS